MPTIELNGKQVSVDEQGFLKNPEIWDEDLAMSLAQNQGLEQLMGEHWAVLRFIRDYYLEHDSAPLIRSICSETGMTLRQIYKLFPSGPAQGACKIAGLPKPEGCV